MNKKEIGNKLKDLRGEKTLAEVAEAIGITTSALWLYENGERVPRDEIKIKIADYYKKSVSSIFFK